jgi:hypothetical protein
MPWDWLPFGRKPQPGLTVEQKLEILEQGGIRIFAPFSANDLIASSSRESLEEPGFASVLLELTDTEQEPPWRNRWCINVWHFDSECIEDHGDYAHIAERMRDMAQGDLPITDIRDYVDIEEGVAWLEFELEGRSIHIDCRVKNDWVDPTLFRRFIDLLGPSRIYLWYDLQGQDCIIACTTREEFAYLKNAGVPFVPLD